MRPAAISARCTSPGTEASIQPLVSNSSAEAPAATPSPRAKSFSFAESNTEFCRRAKTAEESLRSSPSYSSSALPLVDELLHLLLERVDGLLRAEVARERLVEPLRHLERE